MKLDTAFQGFWLARKRTLSANTIRDYSLTFRRLRAYLGNRDLPGIHSADIHKFLNYLQKRHKLSDKSLANVWIALSAFWTWAELELEFPHIIRHKIPCPRYRLPPIEPYTETEIRSMIAACDHKAAWRTRNGRRARSQRPSALREKAILITLIDTGLRASELCNLVLRDYDPNQGRLTILHGKGNKKRVVFLGQIAHKQLWRYLATRPDARPADPLFATRTNTPIDRNNLRRILQNIGRIAGVIGVTVHRFRHTYAINFLRNGGNLLELQRLLGHERIDTLQIYVTLAQSDLAAAQRTASPADNWSL